MDDKLELRNTHPSPKEPAPMHANHNLGASQQRLVKKHTRNSDANAFFNLLTSEHLLDTVESLLPQHRERQFLFRHN